MYNIAIYFKKQNDTRLPLDARLFGITLLLTGTTPEASALRTRLIVRRSRRLGEGPAARYLLLCLRDRGAVLLVPRLLLFLLGLLVRRQLRLRPAEVDSAGEAQSDASEAHGGP